MIKNVRFLNTNLVFINCLLRSYFSRFGMFLTNTSLVRKFFFNWPALVQIFFYL